MTPIPPAVVVGRGTTALGALRSMSRRGVRVYTSCDDGLVPRSRYFRPTVTRSGERWACQLGPEGHQMLADLPLETAVLIPCADNAAMWMAELPEELKDRFPASVASVSALRDLQDKRRFASVCQRLGVPHPRCYPVDSIDDLDAVPFESMPQAFYKPSYSTPFLKKFGVKGRRVRNRQAARDLFLDIHDAEPRAFIQEYVAGGPDDHYFIDGYMDRFGQVRATFARRRIRIFPPDFGNSCYCCNVPLESIEPAWRSLESILKEVQYRGIFSAEFKRDRVDGLYKILEINTRAWLYVEFAAWCGINVCHLAYLDALERPVPNQAVKRPGAECVDMYFDYFSCRAMPRDRRPSTWTLAGQWLRSRKPVFSVTDPMPIACWTGDLIKRRALRAWRGNTGPKCTPSTSDRQPIEDFPHKSSTLPPSASSVVESVNRDIKPSFRRGR